MSENIRSAVHAQVEQKIAAGESLEAAVATEQDAQRVLHEAASTTRSARREAMRAGWTETELKRLGLADASKRTRSRRRRVEATTANAASLDQDQLGNGAPWSESVSTPA